MPPKDYSQLPPLPERDASDARRAAEADRAYRIPVGQHRMHTFMHTFMHTHRPRDPQWLKGGPTS